MTKVLKYNDKVALYGADVTISNAPDFELETTALLARMTSKPSRLLQSLINTTILSLKTSGVWSKGDCMYFRGVHATQASTLNWIKDAHNTTYINNPIFTPKVGIINTSGSYATINYNLFTDADKWTLNSATYYFRFINFWTTRQYMMGIRDVANNIYNYLYHDYFAKKDRGYINNVSTPYNTQLYLSPNRNGGWVRNGDYVQAYDQGSPKGINVATPVTSGFADGAMGELSINDIGNVNVRAAYSGVAFSFYGAGLTADEISALNTTVNYFYDNVGGTF